MSRAPAITVDGSGNSYVSYASEISGGNVNLTTVKRNNAGTLQWAEVNTLTAVGTINTAPEVAYLFSQPDVIDTSGNPVSLPMEITQAIIPPSQTYSSFFAAALPLAETLNVLVEGGGIFSVAVPAGTEVENVKTIKLTKSGSSTISSSTGIATVNIGNPPSSPFVIEVWYAGKNSTRTGLTPNKKRIEGLMFIAPAGPSEVTISLVTATAYTMTVPYLQPTYVYDNTSTGVQYLPGASGAPTFGNYTITAEPSDVSKRWSGATPSLVSGTASSTTYTKMLTGLSPDIEYSVTVTASNSSGLSGPAVSVKKRTPADPGLVPTYVDGIAAPFTTDLPGVSLYYGLASVTAVVKTLTAGKWTQTLPAVGIHHSGNTGSTSAGIMTFGAKMGSATETTLAFGGFPGSAPSASTANSWTLTSGTVADVSSGIASGYYLRVPITVSYSASGGVAAAQTVTLRQNRSGVSTDITKTASVWWDGTPTGTTPIISITGATPDSSKLKQICGTYYWGSDYGFTGINTSFTGMGTHLARANPITVSVADITNSTLFSSLGAPIGSTRLNGSAVYTGSSTYRRDYTMTVTGTNLHGLSGTSAAYAPVGGFPVIDPAGVALWTAVTQASVPTLGSSYSVGHRVSTFTEDSGGTIAVYINTTSLASATDEAIISNGYFCAPGRANAYISYPNGANYSGITTGSGGFTTGYRYATLEWAGLAVSNPSRGGFLGVQIEAPAGVLTLTLDAGGQTNMSAASASDKLKDAAGNFVDLYFNIKYSDGSWLGWKDLNANEDATRLNNASIKSGAQSTDSNKNATYSTLGGVDTFQIFGILPTPVGIQESSILIAAGGKGVTSAGAAFKISACYKTF